MKKRVVAILVIIALLVTLFPVASFADTGDVEVFNKPYKLWGYRIRVYTNTTGSTDQGGYITDDQWGYLNIQGEWNFEAHHYDGYEFTGWTTSGSPSGAYQIDGNKLKIVKSGNENYHAYAHFNFVGYKVTLDLGNGGYFNSNNSSTITLENVPEGELDVPEYTIYDGYSFQGWDRSTNISSNETLHAGYEYEVTFEGNTNVTVTGASPVWTVNHAVSEPSYTVTDAPRFRFDGWDKSLSGISGPTTITANPAVERGYITLMITGHGNFAHRDAVQKWWDIGKKDLHLNNSGPYGDFGWIQTGWFNNNTGEKLPIGADVDVTGDCTYTAIFESLGSRYVNMFVLGSNGRLADNKSGTYQKGTVIDLNSANPVPTTAGYEFKYWEEYIDSSDSWKVVNENSDGEANITVGVVNEYRAVFGLTSHTVTYQDEAGVALGTETVTYGEDATASVLNLPAGSQIDESTDWRDQLADITGDKTVVVTLEYQVTFNLNGGTRTGGGELSQWVGYNEGAEAGIMMSLMR
jgi:hypothetical protein